MFRSLAILLVMAPLLAGCVEEDTDNVSSDCADVDAVASSAGNVLAIWDTTMGCIVVELYLEKTPITAGNFKKLAEENFYDGTRFHRVIGPANSPPDGFMIQDGDPLSKDASKKNQWGTGGSEPPIKDEFPCKDGTTSYASKGTERTATESCNAHGGLLYTHSGAGVLSMANAGPNTGSSQYFITLTATPHLDHKHAIFGTVVQGMETVRAIGAVETDARDRPLTDVVIHSIRIKTG